MRTHRARFARLFTLGLFSSALALSVAKPASAEEWTRRSYILPRGDFEITGEPARPRMVNINMSENSAFDPVTIAPHFYWGVSDTVTLGITHDRGICLGDACGDKVYNDAGFGLLVGLGYGRTYEIDLHVEVPVQSFDPFVLGARVGVLGRVNLGAVTAFVFDPSLYFGMTRRDEGNREYLGLPFWFYFQATDVVVPFVGSGIQGPLDGFSDSFQIPLEGGIVFDVAQNVDVGFVLRFPNLAGKGNSADWRELGFIGRFRF